MSDEPQYQLDARAWRAPRVPTSERKTISQRWAFVGELAHLLSCVPLRQQGELIGVLDARRIEVRPFTPAQIKLLETFADQAVIAIENVRLFNELDTRNRQLTEALEQQTATSEILARDRQLTDGHCNRC